LEWKYLKQAITYEVDSQIFKVQSWKKSDYEPDRVVPDHLSHGSFIWKYKVAF